MTNIDLHTIIIIAALIIGATKGYKTGFARGISHLISIIGTVLTLKLVGMIISSYGTGNVQSGIISIIFLIAFGTIYGIIKKIVSSMKAIANLPIISFIDRILGIIIGVLWAGIFVLFALGFISGLLIH